MSVLAAKNGCVSVDIEGRHLSGGTFRFDVSADGEHSFSFSQSIADSRWVWEAMGKVESRIPGIDQEKAIGRLNDIVMSKASDDRFVEMPELPAGLEEIVSAAAKSIGCHRCYVALPMLSVLASLVGTTRYAVVKRGWNVFPLIWTAIVGDSGSMKSPAFKFATAPIVEMQTSAFDEQQKLEADFDLQKLRHDEAMSEWKRERKKNPDAPLPVAPELPAVRRFYTTDPTLESLAPILNENPRGLLVARDELSAWLGSFDKYSKGAGDASGWLELFNAGQLTVDRKSHTTLHIARAAASITGGIQPKVLQKAMSAHLDSGLCARFLFAGPPKLKRCWTEDEIADDMLASYQSICQRLADLVFDSDSNEPIQISLTPAAKRAFIEFYNTNGHDLEHADGALAAAISKLEEYPVRLALVFTLVADPAAESIDERSIKYSIELTEWFKREANRIYEMFGCRHEASGQLARLKAHVAKHGGVTVRDIRKSGPREFRQVKPEDLEKMLREFCTSKVVGRSTVFHLKDGSDGDASPKNTAKRDEAPSPSSLLIEGSTPIRETARI